MAVKTISQFAVVSYLQYWISRTKCNCLPFDNLPLDISTVSKRRLLDAFCTLYDDMVVESYSECDDGIIFRRSAYLLAVI